MIPIMSLDIYADKPTIYFKLNSKPDRSSKVKQAADLEMTLNQFLTGASVC